MLTVGSLFSGIGGIELGLLRTGGFTVVYHCENDTYCRDILRRHWPSTPCYPDICACYGAYATNERASLLPWTDLLCGGFPCQNISVAGKQEGIEKGKESGLWREFSRLIGEIRPRYVLVENVAALRYTQRKQGRPADLGRVLGDLAAFGYNAEWHCLPASRFGAPHQRDRIFILAYSDAGRWGRTRRSDGRDVGSTPRKDAARERYSQREAVASSSQAVGNTDAERLEGAELLRWSECVSTQSSNTGCHTVELADSDATGLEVGQEFTCDTSAQCTTSQRSGDNTCGEWQDATSQSNLGGVAYGLSARMDDIGRQYRWPARPGEPQYLYEPDRIVIQTLPGRKKRIQALGNAVCVPVAQFLGECMLAMERERCSVDNVRGAHW